MKFGFMDTASLLALTGLYTILLFPVFRVEAKHRRIVAFVTFIIFLLLYDFNAGRGIVGEGWLAFFLALVLNCLFWVLIGRYNPPRSDDEIKVIGLDD
jgi:hypothetical protein